MDIKALTVGEWHCSFSCYYRTKNIIKVFYPKNPPAFSHVLKTPRVLKYFTAWISEGGHALWTPFFKFQALCILWEIFLKIMTLFKKTANTHCGKILILALKKKKNSYSLSALKFKFMIMWLPTKIENWPKIMFCLSVYETVRSYTNW